MPIARFEMPDGRIGRFEVPEGTSPDDATALISQSLSGNAASAQQSPQNPDQRILANDPQYEYGDILPFKKNRQTGELSIAFPEMVRSPVRGMQDLQTLAANRSTDTTPDAIAAMIALAGVPKTAGKIADATYNTVAPTISSLIADQTSGVSMGKATMGASTLAESTAQGAKNVATGAMARNVDTLDEVAGAIKGQASTSYKAMRDANAVLAPKAKSNVFQAIDTDVRATGPLQKDLHSGFLGVMKDFKNALKDPNMGLEEMDQYRQLFRDVVNRNIVRGKPNGDAMKAQTAISAMDKVVNRFGKVDIKGGSPDAVQHLLAGRDNWAKASRFEAITDIIRRSGGNINKLKTDIFKFASNKNNIRGWNKEEIDALKEAAKNSTGEAILKTFGSLGFDIMKPITGGSNVIPALEATAAMAQAPFAAPMLAGGTAAKTTQGFLGRGKVENLLKTLERR